MPSASTAGSDLQSRSDLLFSAALADSFAAVGQYKINGVLIRAVIHLQAIISPNRERARRRDVLTSGKTIYRRMMGRPGKTRHRCMIKPASLASENASSF